MNSDGILDPFNNTTAAVQVVDAKCPLDAIEPLLSHSTVEFPALLGQHHNLGQSSRGGEIHNLVQISHCNWGRELPANL